ncbi:MAG: protein kinase [Candidatus Sumerlaeia bacterium]|nr:protein kinase [Candidatus Sumerlaeia bacterium]
MAHVETLQQVGPYRLVERLGYNGAVATFKAFDTGGHKAACVVALEASEVESAEAYHVFAREATVLRGGGENCVLRPLEFGQQDGVYWAAYSFLTGRHVGSMVQELGLPPVGSTFAIAARMVEALSELHHTGLCHRLITPASIFLTETQEVRLLHAGWTTMLLAVQAGVAHPCFMSNLPFLAPEVAAGQPGTIASDVYSLGANLFFLICGQPVHWAGDPVELTELVATTPVNLLPLQDFIGGDAYILIEEMLEFDPDNRPLNLDALRSRLEALAAELPSLPIDPGPSSVSIQRIMGADSIHGMSTDVERNDLAPPPSSALPPPPPARQLAPLTDSAPPPPPPKASAPVRGTAPPPSRPKPTPPPAEHEEEPKAHDAYRKAVESTGTSAGRAILVIILLLMVLGGIGFGMYVFLQMFVFGDKATAVATEPAKPTATPAPTTRPAAGEATPTPAPPPRNPYRTTAERLEELGKIHRKYIAENGVWARRAAELEAAGASNEWLKDGWNRDFDLRRAFIVSSGADGTFDNDDDIWFDAEEMKLGGRTR